MRLLPTGILNKPEEDVQWLAEALNGLENLAKETSEKTAVALMLNEFQRVVELSGGDAERQIRSAIQTHRRAGYGFAGSKSRMLTEMTYFAGASVLSARRTAVRRRDSARGIPRFSAREFRRRRICSRRRDR